MRQFQLEQATERSLTQIAKNFQYNLDDELDVEDAIETTVAVIRLNQQIHASAWEMGQLLTEQKARLDHGTFGKWLQEVLRWEPRYAQLYMQIFTRWPDKEIYLSSGFGLLPFSEQAALTGDSVPATATERVIDIVKSSDGKAPTVREVKSIIKEEQQKVAVELSLESTCDVLRKYAHNQALDHRAERVETVTLEAAQTLAPRGTKLVEEAFEQARKLVLEEISQTQPVPTASVGKVRYVPADEASVAPSADYPVTERVTLKKSQWNLLATLGDGDWNRGLARLLDRVSEDFE